MICKKDFDRLVDKYNEAESDLHTAIESLIGKTIIFPLSSFVSENTDVMVDCFIEEYDTYDECFTVQYIHPVYRFRETRYIGCEELKEEGRW